MLSEVLLDHTSLHTLRPRLIEPEDLAARAREVLQVTENLLFADTLWVSDTVTSETMDWTNRIYAIFAKHGLGNARGSGYFRISQVSQGDLLKICRRAAPTVFDCVRDLPMKSLALTPEEASYGVRPHGAQPTDYERLFSFKFGSEHAMDYVHGSVLAKGWLPSSTLPLLNADLFRWLKQTADLPTPERNSVHLQFNTICRWKFNQELAGELGEDGAPVSYIPAFGRATAIDRLHLMRWRSELEKLEIALKNEFVGKPQLFPDFGEYTPTHDVSLPLFGIWILTSLKEDCKLEDLVEAIVKARGHRHVRNIKAWLNSQCDHEIDLVCEEVRQEIQKTYPTGVPDQTEPPKYKSTIKFVLKPWLSPFQWEVQHQEDVLGSTWAEKKRFLVRKLKFMSREATILTGLIEKSFLRSKDHPVLRRVGSLLAEKQ